MQQDPCSLQVGCFLDDLPSRLEPFFFRVGRFDKRTDALLLLVSRLSDLRLPALGLLLSQRHQLPLCLNRPDCLANLLDDYPLAMGVVLAQLRSTNQELPGVVMTRSRTSEPGACEAWGNAEAT